MNKKIISSFVVVLMIISSISYTAFAAMSKGTVVIGSKAFDLNYANDPVNLTEIGNEIVMGGEIYVKDFNGNWINNITGLTVDASVIPAVLYKNAGGVTNFAAEDKDGVDVSTASELATALANQSVAAINLTGSFADNLIVTRPITINFGDYTLTGDISFKYDVNGTSVLTGNSGNRVIGDLTVNTPNASFKNGVKVSGAVNVVNVEPGTWTESADGNILTITDSDGASITVTGNPGSIIVTEDATGSLTLTVNAGATVTNITSNANMNIVVATGAAVTNITTEEGAGGTIITNNGTIGTVTSNVPTNITVAEGATVTNIIVAAGSGGSTITNNGTTGTVTANVPINLVANVAPGSTITGESGSIVVSGTNSNNVVVTPVITPAGNSSYNTSHNHSSIGVTGIAVTGAGDATSVVSYETLLMSATVTPANATNDTISWSVATLAGGIATINSTTGLLTSTGVGTFRITATNAASGVFGVKDITVVAPINNYTALGDSITYGMSADQGLGYANIFSNYLNNNSNEGIKLLNLGIPGEKSSDLLSLLQNDITTINAVSKAKVITISVGGNNLLTPVIIALASAFQLDPASVTFADDLAAALVETENQQTLSAVIGELPTNLAAGVQQFSTDWIGIIGTIKSIAPEAEIYAMTLYNPINIEDPLYMLFEPAIRGINTIIRTPNAGYKVADVYTAFHDYTGTDPLTGFSLFTGNLDPHPTTKGHEVIYQCHIGAKEIVAVSAITITGDVMVGSTLTAALTPSGATGTYQWESADTVDGTYANITGATSSTYVIDVAYEGKFIKVTFTASGSYIGTQTSAATTAIVVSPAQTLTDTKIAAHGALTTQLGTYTEGNYTAENWTTLTGFKTAGDTAIDLATDVAGVTTAQTTATDGMGGVAIAPVVNTYSMTGSVSGKATGVAEVVATVAAETHKYVAADSTRFDEIGYPKVAITEFTKTAGNQLMDTPVIIKVAGIDLTGLQLFGYQAISSPSNEDAWWDITADGWGDGTMTIENVLTAISNGMDADFYATGSAGMYTFKLQMVDAATGNTVLAETGDLTVTIQITNKILNGDFETGDFKNWNVVTSGNFPTIQEDVTYEGDSTAHMGDGADGMYDENFGNFETFASISQTLFVKDDETTVPVLNLAYCVVGDDFDFDGMKIIINDEVVVNIPSEDTNGWQLVSYDLSEYIGESINLEITSWIIDGAIKVDYYVDNVFISYEAPNAEQAAPTGLAGVAPTEALSDGKITGTTIDMEYKLEKDSMYKICSEDETIVATAGDYVVRYTATVGFNAGADASVTVTAYVASVILDTVITKGADLVDGAASFTWSSVNGIGSQNASATSSTGYTYYTDGAYLRFQVKQGDVVKKFAEVFETGVATNDTEGGMTLQTNEGTINDMDGSNRERADWGVAGLEGYLTNLPNGVNYVFYGLIQSATEGTKTVGFEAGNSRTVNMTLTSKVDLVPGTYTVTVETLQQGSADVKGTITYTFIVKEPVTVITVTGAGDRTEVGNGETLQMSATVSPSDADPSVTWSVEAGTGTATIDGAGLLTGTSIGTVTVKATANDASVVEGTLGVTVEPIILVSTVADLNNIRDNLTGHYIQTVDINLESLPWTPIAENNENMFSGSYNGNGFKISNLSIISTEAYVYNIGLFGHVSGKIKNVVLENVLIDTKSSSIGALVGSLGVAGIVENSHIKGVGSIKGNSNLGGLVGDNLGLIEECSVRGDINIESISLNKQGLGGLVGRNGGTIVKSFADVKVYGDVYGIGGLVGINYFPGDLMGKIIQSYATGEVTTTKAWAGGLVGDNRYTDCLVTESYASGKVIGGESGGLIGLNNGGITQGIVENSYYDKETTLQSDAGKGLSRTTLQMKKGIANSKLDADGDTSTEGDNIYTEWDSGIWYFGTDSEYPRLSPNQEQAAPTETLVGVAPTTVDNNDGRITGVTTAMEYKLSTATDYVVVTGTDITGLATGTYIVRYAAKEGYNVGATVAVTVPAYVASVVTLSSIAITTPATKLVYKVGDTLDITGMVVTGTYSDTTTKPETVVAGDITGFDSSAVEATQTLTVTVGGKTVTYGISIVKADGPALTDVTIDDTENTVTGMTAAMEFSTDGTTWIAYNATTPNLPDLTGTVALQVRVAATSTNEAGAATIFNFTILVVTLSSIEITIPATKLAYKVGDTLDITGMVVTGTYSDTTTKSETVVAGDITGFVSSAVAATQTLTVTVGGKTATYDISIAKAEGPALTGVTIDDTENTVTGITAVMEFSTDGTTWTEYNATTPNLPNLTGTVALQVRVAETATNEAGAAITFNFTIEVNNASFTGAVWNNSTGLLTLNLQNVQLGSSFDLTKLTYLDGCGATHTLGLGQPTYTEVYVQGDVQLGIYGMYFFDSVNNMLTINLSDADWFAITSLPDNVFAESGGATDTVLAVSGWNTYQDIEAAAVTPQIVTVTP